MRSAALVLLLSALPIAAQKPLIEGNPQSSVRVVIYEDLQCPDCANFRQMLDQELLPRFKSTVAFEHRDFPLAKHAWARKAAVASRAFEAISPGLAVEFRKATMGSQPNITETNFPEHVKQFATRHKVDPGKVLAALEDPKLASRVEEDYQEGIARGVARTPTVLVNGEPFIEQFPAEEIIQAIQREVAAAKQ
jgi:protein-disulfide isomerase